MVALARPSSSTPRQLWQRLWSQVYVDAMILRDRDTDPNTAGLEERVYAVHDANFNITGLVDASGAVIERYLYDPYGERTVLDANWAADSDGLSDVAFAYGHHGGRHDLDVGLVHFRFRDLDTSLGRWTRQDPLGYIDGGNLYGYVGADPVASVDPDGLRIWREWRESEHTIAYGTWYTGRVRLKFDDSYENCDITIDKTDITGVSWFVSNTAEIDAYFSSEDVEVDGCCKTVSKVLVVDHYTVVGVWKLGMRTLVETDYFYEEVTCCKE